MRTHRVKQGDSLTSLEEQYGVPWSKIWNRKENSNLKSKRKDPNILSPGDRIRIPNREKRKEFCSDGSKHSFKLSRSQPTLKIYLKVRALDGQEIVLSNENYELQFDVGEAKNGTTTGEGCIEENVPTKARSATITIPSQNLVVPINLGYVDPIDQLSGIQCRMNMLGYECGAVDGKNGPITRAAVKAFQKDTSLQVDGIAGSKTQNKLKEAFGS